MGDFSVQRLFPPLVLLAMFLGPGAATGAWAGVFGDGISTNGIEDDRRGFSAGAPGFDVHHWYRSAGTLVCDGAVRGSATLLDLSELAPEAPGGVIATAAHVFYDLDSGQRWNRCTFHYMGLGALPGHRILLQSRNLNIGPFDPLGDPGEPASGAGDWAFAWLGPDWNAPQGALGLKPVVPEQSAGLDSLGLLAWDPQRAEVTVSMNCHAVHSTPGDLGGGAWAGQLLDDCDSGDGASGGGLVSGQGADSRFLAIRGGAHWDEALWPSARFPLGPPRGEPWDPSAHTNYARALDRALLGELESWARRLARGTGAPVFLP